MTATLPHKEVVVNGKKLKVFQASFLMKMNRQVMINEAAAKWTTPPNGVEENLRYYTETVLYPSLAACSEGDVPSSEEYLSCAEVEIEAWATTVYELNPHWAPQLFDTEEEKAVAEEKKE